MKKIKGIFNQKGRLLISSVITIGVIVLAVLLLNNPGKTFAQLQVAPIGVGTGPIGTGVGGLGSSSGLGQAPLPTVHELHGFAWSSYAIPGSTTPGGMGWLSMNCDQQTSPSYTPPGMGVCTSMGGSSDYKVTVDPNGNFKGDAWSSNMGWVSFDSGEVSGCPIPDSESSDGCTGHLNFITGKVSGWARVISVPASGDNGHNGNWNGWIHLSGTNHASPGNGVTYDLALGILKHFAYGGSIAPSPQMGTEVLGWIDFSPIFGGVWLDEPKVTVLHLCATDPSGNQACDTPSTGQSLSTTAQTNLTISWNATLAQGLPVAYDTCTASATTTGTQWNGSVASLVSPSYAEDQLGVNGPSTSSITYSIKCRNASNPAHPYESQSVTVDANQISGPLLHLTITDSNNPAQTATSTSLPFTAQPILTNAGDPLQLTWEIIPHPTTSTSYTCNATGDWDNLPYQTSLSSPAYVATHTLSADGAIPLMKFTQKCSDGTNTYTATVFAKVSGPDLSTQSCKSPASNSFSVQFSATGHTTCQVTAPAAYDFGPFGGNTNTSHTYAGGIPSPFNMTVDCDGTSYTRNIDLTSLCTTSGPNGRIIWNER